MLATAVGREGVLDSSVYVGFHRQDTKRMPNRAHKALISGVKKIYIYWASHRVAMCLLTYKGEDVNEKGIYFNSI